MALRDLEWRVCIEMWSKSYEMALSGASVEQYVETCVSEFKLQDILPGDMDERKYLEMMFELQYWRAKEALDKARRHEREVVQFEEFVHDQRRIRHDKAKYIRAKPDMSRSRQFKQEMKLRILRSL